MPNNNINYYTAICYTLEATPLRNPPLRGEVALKARCFAQ